MLPPISADTSGIGLAKELTGSDRDLYIQLTKWTQDAETAVSETKYRDTAKEDYDFYAGDQDSIEVIQKLQADKRPNTTFNEVKPKVDLLIGMADQIRTDPLAYPVGAEDQALAELANGAIKHIRTLESIPDKEMECFEHMAKGGRSFMHFYVSMENPYEPEIKVKRIHGRDVLIDPDSVEYDMSDARYLTVAKWFTEEEIKSFWPEFDGKLAQLSQNPIGTYNPQYFNVGTDKYCLRETWYRKLQKVFWFTNPLTGKPDWLLEEDWKQFCDRIKEGIRMPDGQTLQSDTPPQSVQVFKKVIYFVLWCGMQFFDKGRSPFKADIIPYVLYGAYKHENENRWFGAVTALKDPQRMINTMRRQFAHLLQTAPKGILMHEVGSIINIDEYDEQSSKPNFKLELASGASGKVKFSDQPQISPVYGQLDATYIQALKDISGIQDPLMGIQTSSREPGVTQKMRMESNLAVLFIIFGNFRKSRMLGGKILFSLIQQYITYPLIVRMEGMEGQKLMQMNTQMNPQSPEFNDISIGKFDITIDESDENITMRRYTAQMLMEFANNNPGAIPPDIILEYLDVPLTAKIRVQEWSKMQMVRQDAMQKAQMDLEMAKVEHQGEVQIKTSKQKGASK